MMYIDLEMIEISEKILSYMKPVDGGDGEEIVALKERLKRQKAEICIQMQEHLEIIEECCDDVTQPPWCGFSDDKKVLAVMAAGRPFDVFKFEEPPKDADAHYLLLTQPHIIKAMIGRIRELEGLSEIAAEKRWTKDERSDNP